MRSRKSSVESVEIQMEEVAVKQKRLNFGKPMFELLKMGRQKTSGFRKRMFGLPNRGRQTDSQWRKVHQEDREAMRQRPPLKEHQRPIAKDQE
jgi:hypothetical protein